MRHVAMSLFLLLTVTSCGSTGLGLTTPLDINGTWIIDSEQGNVRASCITFTDNKVSRLGDCDTSPGITTLSYNPGATISSSDEVVVTYRVNADAAEPTVLLDLVRHTDGKLRGVMIIYTNSVATTSTTYTNMVLTRQ